ncbi:hypothetical protein PILCRDRAFT_812031 [Piloderma croceum F 1598]|uniref:Uncharacterized protein n=1 Tax=Piloderma croceum (strain F 1598) TaxID=765440 RepID=A0A0C3BUS0_PILCF|nr:hypothetical protein PILCRDRAFT_812031 [Piloderma croceum F 1598]
MYSKAIRAIVFVSMCYGALAAPAGQVAGRGCRINGGGNGCSRRDVADTAASVAI